MVHNIDPAWVEWTFNPVFVGIVRRAFPKFMHVPIGNSRNEEDTPPNCLLVESLTIRYRQQSNQNYCLGYGLASCLHYLGLKVERNKLRLQCKTWGYLPGEASLKALAKFMQELVFVGIIYS